MMRKKSILTEIDGRVATRVVEEEEGDITSVVC
jgi:hypothetical protein